MEKQFKPVPDVKELKYHGTKDKPDIKIFVSHRIDQDSEIIDNPLYIPVRCGAVYDERANAEMLGDDVGENKKCKYYEDLTVEYWAWKNEKCDYFGFCTSQKYLSFDQTKERNSKRNRDQEGKGLLVASSVSDAQKRFGLDRTALDDLLNRNDVIAIYPHNITEDGAANVNSCLLQDIYHFDSEIITSVLKIIQYKFPQYLPFANQYFMSQEIEAIFSISIVSSSSVYWKNWKSV